jgi:hypothetical protein
MDANIPQFVASYLTEQEAAALIGQLGSLGIKADMWGADSSAVWPAVPRNVQVVVRQSDLARTKAAIQKLRRESTRPS